MASQVLPPSDTAAGLTAAAVLVLPENVLAVAFEYSIRLARFTDGNLSWLGTPLQVRDGSISVLGMFPWGRSGLCVLDDTYYFFNYSAATRGAASLWQTTLVAQKGPPKSTEVNNLIGIAGGFVALLVTEAGLWSAIYFTFLLFCGPWFHVPPHVCLRTQKSQEHSMNASLVFLTNSTTYGDWTTAVLGVDVDGRHSNSIVAASWLNRTTHCAIARKPS